MNSSSISSYSNENMELKCPDCDKTFANKGSLYNHKVRTKTSCKINKNLGYICLICKEQFTVLKYAKEHIASCFTPDIIKEKEITKPPQKIDCSLENTNKFLTSYDVIPRKINKSKSIAVNTFNSGSTNESNLTYIKLKSKHYTSKNLYPLFPKQPRKKRIQDYSKEKEDLLSSLINITDIQEYRKKRISLLKYITISEYEKYIKNIENKETFYSSELRLIFLSDILLEYEDLRLMNNEYIKALSCKINKGFVAFDINNLLENICNSAVFHMNIEDILRLLLINEFPNIIYLNLEASDIKENPYSFYTLTKVEGEKRYWTQDLRLIGFACSLEPLISFYISHYEKLYLAHYGSLEFFSTMKQDMKLENKILIENISLLSQMNIRVRLCQKIIIENNTYEPYSNDIFNTFEDFHSSKEELDSFNENSGIETVITEITELFPSEPEEIRSLCKKYYPNVREIIKRI